MRQLIVILALTCSLQPMTAQVPDVPQTPNSSPPPAPMRSDMLADVLWRIAVASHTPIGFESIERTRAPGALTQTPSLGSWTLEKTLDASVAMDDRYEWRRVDDMIVVRPKAAWADAADPLNRHVQNLQADAMSPSAVLRGLRDVVYTKQFVVRQGPSAGTVSLRIDSGTVLDVLNRLTMTSDHVMWLAFYREQPDKPGWDLWFELRNARHVDAALGSRKPDLSGR